MAQRQILPIFGKIDKSGPQVGTAFFEKGHVALPILGIISNYKILTNLIKFLSHKINGLSDKMKNLTQQFKPLKAPVVILSRVI